MSKLKSFLANFNDRELIEIYKDNELLHEGTIKEVMDCLEKDYTVVAETVTLNAEYIIIKVK